MRGVIGYEEVDGWVVSEEASGRRPQRGKMDLHRSRAIDASFVQCAIGMHMLGIWCCVSLVLLLWNLIGKKIGEASWML